MGESANRDRTRVEDLVTEAQARLAELRQAEDLAAVARQQGRLDENREHLVSLLDKAWMSIWWSLVDSTFNAVNRRLLRTLRYQQDGTQRPLWRPPGEIKDIAENLTWTGFDLAEAKLIEFDPQRGPFVNWVYHLARRPMRQVLRKLYVMHLPDNVTDRESSRPSPEEEYLHLEQSELILNAIGRLPPAQRAALIAYYFWYDHLRKRGRVAAVAQHLSKSHSAVHSLLSRGRDRLRLELREGGEHQRIV